jgi:hypothetical protein
MIMSRSRTVPVYISRQLPGGTGEVIVRHDLSSGAEAELVRAEALAGILVSHDGRQIATTVSVDPATERRRILLVPVDGGKPREMASLGAKTSTGVWKQLAADGAIVTPLAWTPDGRALIAIRSLPQEKRIEVWQVPIEAGVPHKLEMDFAWGVNPVINLSLSPDGHQIA